MSEQELNNDRQNQGFGDEIKSFFWETFKVVFLALIIILPIRYYVMQPFFVKGASMEPGFELLESQGPHGAGVFLGVRHLSESFSKSLGNEDGIQTETVVPYWSFGNASFYFAYKNMFLL